MAKLDNLGLNKQAKKKYQGIDLDKTSEDIGNSVIKKISWNLFMCKVIDQCDKAGIPIKSRDDSPEDGALQLKSRIVDARDPMPGAVFRIYTKIEYTNSWTYEGSNRVRAKILKKCYLEIMPCGDHKCVKLNLGYEVGNKAGRINQGNWSGPYLYDSPISNIDYLKEKGYAEDDKISDLPPCTFVYVLCEKTVNNIVELILELNKFKDVAKKMFEQKRIIESSLYKLIEKTINKDFVPVSDGTRYIQKYKFSDSVIEEGKSYNGINLDLNEKLELGLNKRAKDLHNKKSEDTFIEEMSELDMDTFFEMCSKIFNPSTSKYIVESIRGIDNNVKGWHFWYVKFVFDPSKKIKEEEIYTLYIRVIDPGILTYYGNDYNVTDTYFFAYFPYSNTSPVDCQYPIGRLAYFNTYLMSRDDIPDDMIVPLMHFGHCNKLTCQNLKAVKDLFEKILNKDIIYSDFSKDEYPEFADRAIELAKKYKVLSEAQNIYIGLNKKAKDLHDKKSEEDEAIEIGELSFVDFFNEVKERFEDLSKKYNGGKVNWYPDEIDPDKRKLVRDFNWISVSFKGVGRFIMGLKSKYQLYPPYKNLLEETFHLDCGYTTNPDQNVYVSNDIHYFGPDKCAVDPDNSNKWYYKMNYKNLDNAIKWIEDVVKQGPDENRRVQMESTINLGMNKKAKKKFEDINAIDNIGDFVDLGLPSGNLWCKYNYGANEEYENGEYLDYESAIKLDLSSTDYLRLPFKKDFEELCNCCFHKVSKINGVDGMMFTSLINGQSIFFPAAGFYFPEYKKAFFDTKGFYWTSTTSVYSYSSNYNLSFDCSKNAAPYLQKNSQNNCFSIRLLKNKDNSRREINESNTNLGINKKAKDIHNDRSIEDQVQKLSELSVDDFLDLAEERLRENAFVSNIKRGRYDPDMDWDWVTADYNKVKMYIRIDDISKNPYALCYYSIELIGNYPYGYSFGMRKWLMKNKRKISNKYSASLTYGEHMSMTPSTIDKFMSFLEKVKEKSDISKGQYWFDEEWALEHSVNIEPEKLEESSINLGLNQRAKKEFSKSDEDKVIEDLSIISKETFVEEIKKRLSDIADFRYDAVHPSWLNLYKKSSKRKDIVDGIIRLSDNIFAAKYDTYADGAVWFKSDVIEEYRYEDIWPARYLYNYKTIDELEKFFREEIAKENEEYGE